LATGLCPGGPQAWEGYSALPDLLAGFEGHGKTVKGGQGRDKGGGRGTTPLPPFPESKSNTAIC